MKESLLIAIAAILLILCGCKKQVSDSEEVSLQVSSAAYENETEVVEDNWETDSLMELQRAAGVMPEENDQDEVFSLRDGVLFMGNNPVNRSISSLDLTNLDADNWLFLREFTALEGLILNASNMTEADFQVVASLPALSTLIVFNYPFQSIDALASCSGLQSLYISTAEELCDVTMLSKLTELTDLSVFQAPNLTDCSAIAELEKLQILTLNEVGLDDISFLNGKETITALTLQFIQNELDYAPLATVSNLETLSIIHSSFSQLEAIKDLKSLSNLYVYSTDVESFAPLASYQLPLKQIGCDASEEDLKILKEAYPNCVFE